MLASVEIEVWDGDDTKKGYKTNTTQYGFSGKLYRNNLQHILSAAPIFKCPSSNALYTLKVANKGNKVLDKPIGLITTDEAYYAGYHIAMTTNTNYLYNGQKYWTMTPLSFFRTYSSVYLINSGSYSNKNLTYGIRLVINLREMFKLQDLEPAVTHT